MSLFLKTAIYESTEEDTGDVYIEAYQNLIEASSELFELDDFLLNEDFKIHRQNELLTEEEAKENDKNFFQKAIDKIIGFIKTVKDKVVKFVSGAMERLAQLFGKAKEKPPEEMPAPSGAGNLLVNIAGAVTSVTGLIMAIKPGDSGNDAKQKKIDEEKNGIKGMFEKVTGMFSNPSNTQPTNVSLLDRIMGSKSAWDSYKNLTNQQFDADLKEIERLKQQGFRGKIKARKMERDIKRAEKQAIREFKKRSSDLVTVSGFRGQLIKFGSKIIAGKVGKDLVKANRK